MTEQKHIVIIGGGPAGLQAASGLKDSRHQITIIEKESTIGGKLNSWHKLFPEFQTANDISVYLINSINNSNTEVLKQTIVTKITRENNHFKISTAQNHSLKADAILLATGFELFRAEKKEEYGYGIYKNIITSADLESSFRQNGLKDLLLGKTHPRIGFIHCVGSRDKKCGNTYCSKVCCVTGVKQAIEIKQLIPHSQVFNFYMDLRMYGQNFEELYIEAQQDYSINFIRGRVSEIAENIDGTLQIKAEDTLSGRPLKMNFDLVILLAGMENRQDYDNIMDNNIKLSRSNGFIVPINRHVRPNETTIPGIFIAGTCREPLSIQETIADAKSAASTITEWINKQSN